MAISTHLPETMSPDERRTEIAELLARGVLRHQEARRRSGQTPESFIGPTAPPHAVQASSDT
jgi:hypothetical protein